MCCRLRRGQAGGRIDDSQEAAGRAGFAVPANGRKFERVRRFPARWCAASDGRKGRSGEHASIRAFHQRRRVRCRLLWQSGSSTAHCLHFCPVQGGQGPGAQLDHDNEIHLQRAGAPQARIEAGSRAFARCFRRLVPPDQSRAHPTHHPVGASQSWREKRADPARDPPFLLDWGRYAAGFSAPNSGCGAPRSA